MNDVWIELKGQRLLLDPLGGLFWPEASVLVVADLHLEKGSACAARGQLVPPWDSGLTLARLGMLVRRHRPACVVAVGDSFHDDGGPRRLGTADAQTLAGLTAEARFVWVSGNHDPAPPQGVGGSAAGHWEQRGLVFRHQAVIGDDGEVSGHFHPKARIATRGGDIVRPCFVCDENKLLLPAFGAYTGGLDVRAPALARLFPGRRQVYLLGRERVFGFAMEP